MIKKILLPVLALLIPAYSMLSAVRVKVLDSETNAPVCYATVKAGILSGAARDSSVNLKTNIDGEVTLPGKAKSFILKLTHVNYKTVTDTVSRSCEIFMEPAEIILDAIVTTGQYIPQSSQKSVYPVKIVNKARIEAQSAPNLRDLLQTEAGIKITQDGVLGSLISINGVSGQNVKIMIDGVPVTGRMNGNIDISQINLSNAERVEIIEGPMSTIYGTDALGGVINIITKEKDSDKLNASLNSYYESVNIANFDGALNFGINGYKAKISGGRNFFGGYSVRDTSRHKQWKPKIQYFGDIAASKSFGDLHLRLTNRLFNEFILNRGEPRPPYGITAFDEEYITWRNSSSLFASAKLKDKLYINATANYSYYERFYDKYYTDLVTLDRILTDDPQDHDTTRFDTWMLRSTFSHDKATERLSYQFGLDFLLDRGEGGNILDGHQEIGDYASFLSVQYMPITTLKLQPGLRFIYNTQYGSKLIPSLNIKEDITENIALRASYARGFRAPRIKELYMFKVDLNHNIIGNPDLQAENSDSYNLAFTFDIVDDYYIFRIEPKFFYNDIDNMIENAIPDQSVKEKIWNEMGHDTTDLWSYVNIYKAKTAGSSLSIGFFTEKLTMNTTLAYIGINSQEENEGRTSEFNFAPEAQFSCNYTLPWHNIRLSLYYKYTGEQPRFMIYTKKDSSQGLRKYFIEDYHMLDISASADFADKLLSLTIGAKNLLNVRDIQSSAVNDTGVHVGGTDSYPIAWGRTAFARLTINI